MKHHSVLMKYTLLILSTAMLGFVLLPRVVSAQYAEWSNRGTLALLTTPDGADLPESARVEEFPVLVRLTKETFDFSQANPDGSDIRVSADGMPLAFQVEQWDQAAGIACIWVRIPVLRGNSRQVLTLHWGRADAKSESKGSSVFNASNGFLVVMHLGDPDGPKITDEVGSITPTDKGTTECQGAIGRGRRFKPGQGIACGEKIETLPSGVGPHTTELWLKAEQVNSTVIGWGNEQGQGKVVMQVRSPPHINMDCYFSNGSIASSKKSLPISEWIHAVYSFQQGGIRLYLNGQLAGSSDEKGGPLNIRNPARMWLGGWYNNFNFGGEIDEVRISNVNRSADWVKLSYENQKPNQTLVGTLPQPGTTLSVSAESIILNEGRGTTITGQAGGADKIYWILKRGDDETILATDRFSCEINAGRVTAETSWTLRLKAVYPDGVKIRDVPILIRDSIPEPQFSLSAPTKWNGRDTIEIIPKIKNLAALKGAGAADLTYRWAVSGGAVIKEVAADRLILRRSQYTGPIRVTAFIGNGGKESEATVDIQVTEPRSDSWVNRTPEKDEKPEAGQFYARDDRNEGTLFYNGSLDEAVDSVFLRVFADDNLYQSETQSLGADMRYAFTIKLKPGLVKYSVEFGTKTAGIEKRLDRVDDLVCGDAYLIDGQSNALATDTGEDAPRETSEWIRSYGGPTGRDDGVTWVRDRIQEAKRAGLERPNLWCRPVWKRNAPEHQAELGWWGMELAKGLVAKHKVPVCIIQAAIGGSRIDEHQPSPNDHTDLRTMYGRMLWRVQQARLTHGIRAVIWHQGENDQGADGPTGGYGWETYQQLFIDMSAGWKWDMPNVRHYYLFQIWPNACAMGGRDGSGDRLREAQRTLPSMYSNMSILSTLGIKPPGGCHYPLEGWAEFARLCQPLIERDFHGVSVNHSITPPNLRRVRFTSAAKDEIVLDFDQPIIWHDKLARELYLDDQSGNVAAGVANGQLLTLKLKEATSATKITYLKERDWSQGRLIMGANGLAALTFCDVDIDSEP